MLALNSYYLTSLYQAVGLGFSLPLIFGLTGPSIINGALAIAICLNTSIPAFNIFFLYARLMRARISALTSDLNKLTAKTNVKSIRKRLLVHLKRLNAVLNQWELSRRYFEKSLASFIPVVLVTLALFPSMLILSGQIFTNRLSGFYLVNLFGLLLPITIINEQIKREVSVNRFL